MDYNITFKHKGIGKQASGIRQKVLQSQKSATTKAGVTATSGRETITSLKTLNNSILKLIASNKNLAIAIGRGVGGGIAGGIGRAAGGAARGGGAAFGRIGAAIPILGAGIAALGFTIQKINQIGNAYISKASQQIGNVGIAGMRRGQGVYTASQMGAGMKAYGMATGRFSGKERPSRSALDVGAIYGLSAEETLRTAGQFQRAGADYQQAAYVGAGMGIESDLPTLLTGMADLLTDAVKNGINTSDMSKDMAKEISSLAIRTPGKSVEAAINIIKSFQGVQKGLERGKITGAQGLLATRASQKLLMEKITGKEGSAYIENLTKQGFISEKQGEKLRGLKKGTGFEELPKEMAFALLRKFTTELRPGALQKGTIQETKKSFGDTPEGRQRFYDFAVSTGFAESQAQLETLMGYGKKEPIKGPETKGLAEKGKTEIEKRAKKVERGEAGMAVKRMQEREALIFKYGASFAQSSLKMEKAMLTLAEKAAPAAVSGINAVGVAATALAGLIEGLAGKVKKATGKKGEFSVSKFIGLPSFDIF